MPKSDCEANIFPGRRHSEVIGDWTLLMPAFTFPHAPPCASLLRGESPHSPGHRLEFHVLSVPDAVGRRGDPLAALCSDQSRPRGSPTVQLWVSKGVNSREAASFTSRGGAFLPLHAPISASSAFLAFSKSLPHAGLGHRCNS